eukprot:COSAG06_NODE_1200_length_10292_cov_59.321201_7_plen_143_part_00
MSLVQPFWHYICPEPVLANIRGVLYRMAPKKTFLHRVSCVSDGPNPRFESGRLRRSLHFGRGQLLRLFRVLEQPDHLVVAGLLHGGLATCLPCLFLASLRLVERRVARAANASVVLGACNRPLFSQLLLALSRACLGKLITY